MNEMKPITPKRVIIGIVLVVVFVFITSYFQSALTQQTLGLSGTVQTYGAPPAFTVPGNYEKNVAMQRQAVDSFDGGAPAYNAVSENGYAVAAPMPTSPAAPPLGDAKIIKSGNLSLLVKNTEDAALQIDAIRVSLGGQPGNASLREYSPGVKSGNITVWVPADKFGGAMGQIKKLALRVENESVNVQDVSAQFVDISSRLKNLHAAEAAYVEIMKRSGKISEVLEVTRALNDTRSQIEQLQGQLDYLSRQTALSSIDVYLSQEAIPGAVTNEWRPMTIVKAAAKQALNDLTDFIDMLLVMLVRLPIMLLYLAWWFLIFWLIYRAARFLYHRLKQSSMFGPPKQ